eukprot:365226-Chlamydomonas_euryale.AAC.13
MDAPAPSVRGGGGGGSGGGGFYEASIGAQQAGSMGLESRGGGGGGGAGLAAGLQRSGTLRGRLRPNSTFHRHLATLLPGYGSGPASASAPVLQRMSTFGAGDALGAGGVSADDEALRDAVMASKSKRSPEQVGGREAGMQAGRESGNKGTTGVVGGQGRARCMHTWCGDGEQEKAQAGAGGGGRRGSATCRQAVWSVGKNEDAAWSTRGRLTCACRRMLIRLEGGVGLGFRVFQAQVQPRSTVKSYSQGVRLRVIVRARGVHGTRPRFTGSRSAHA